jgi:hypothetical protein
MNVLVSATSRAHTVRAVAQSYKAEDKCTHHELEDQSARLGHCRVHCEEHDDWVEHFSEVPEEQHRRHLAHSVCDPAQHVHGAVNARGHLCKSDSGFGERWVLQVQQNNVEVARGGGGG